MMSLIRLRGCLSFPTAIASNNSLALIDAAGERLITRCRTLRLLSSSSSSGKDGNSTSSDSKSFRPRRRPPKDYRPTAKARKDQKRKDWSPGNNSKFVQLGQVEDPRDELDATFGPIAAGVVRDVRRSRKQNLTWDEEVDEALRMVDYFNAPDGSTEDLVGERRALARQGLDDPTSREQAMEEIDELIKGGRLMNLGLLEDDVKTQSIQDISDIFGDEDTNLEDQDQDTTLDPNQLAHGEWSELLVTVDRNIKLWRGGRLESYRALVVGGNMNGCGGFGIGKSLDPLVAVDIAGRRCKRNIFFVDRYQGNGLTSDLVGKQNSCVVTLRATDNGLRGNELCSEILKRFGITNCVSKSHGNRNPFNVVRATFKALLTHESLEDIALKRGKRIVSLDRAMRMQI